MRASKCGVLKTHEHVIRKTVRPGRRSALTMKTRGEIITVIVGTQGYSWALHYYQSMPTQIAAVYNGI